MATQTQIENARNLGTKDGNQEAFEAIESGTYSLGSDFDSGLINAIGGTKTSELFGVELNSDDFAECCRAYNQAAVAAWNAAKTEK